METNPPPRDCQIHAELHRISLPVPCAGLRETYPCTSAFLIAGLFKRGIGNGLRLVRQQTPFPSQGLVLA